MAGTPTKADVLAMLSEVIDLAHTGYQAGVDALPKVEAMEGATKVRGDFGAQAHPNNALAVRARLASVAERTFVRQIIEPVVRELAVLYDSPHAAGDISRAARDAVDGLTSDGDTFQTRGISYGTPTPNGANAGNGVIRRLTVNVQGQNLEGLTYETKTIVCVQDQHNGRQRHAEILEVRGGSPGIDMLAPGGTGSDQSPRLPSRNSATNASDGSMLPNSSFDVGVDDNPTETTMFSDWTLSTLTGVSRETGNVYRGNPGTPAGSEVSLRMTGTVTARMVLNDKGITFNGRTPYYLGVRVYKPAGATGNVVIGFGSVTQSVDLTSLSDNAWSLVELPLTNSLYYENWNADQAYVTVEVQGASADIDFDDLILAPLTFVDGSWWICIGGDQPFLAGRDALPLGDRFTAVDSGAAAAAAKIQHHWAYVAGYPSLPSSASPTVPDPA